MATSGLCESFHFAQRGREGEREGWREEPAERRRVEKSAEEVRCGNKHALGVKAERNRGEERNICGGERRDGGVERGEECKGGKVMERCE